MQEAKLQRYRNQSRKGHLEGTRLSIEVTSTGCPAAFQDIIQAGHRCAAVPVSIIGARPGAWESKSPEVQLGAHQTPQHSVLLNKFLFILIKIFVDSLDWF